MVQLADVDIKTREVLDWKGVHLLHFDDSSCSQKIRIFLNLKGIDWVSHPVDLARQKNYSSWFLGINPRGLVPVLVHDGDVHVESNDILNYLEQAFPEPPLITSNMHNEVQHKLHQANEFQLDVRAITMRFIYPQMMVMKDPATLDAYASHRGTIEGKPDLQKEEELTFWRNMAREGITDGQVRRAAKRLKRCYKEFEQQLGLKKYLAGNQITLLDIVWFIYTHRLTLAGYPFKKLHPHVDLWYRELLSKPDFAKEVKPPIPMTFITPLLHIGQFVRGKSFRKIGDLVPDKLYEL